MRVKAFAAEEVFGRLNFDVYFDDSLTFLIGLNGCGKTTALRLLVGLLTPSLRTLAEIPFRKARVVVSIDGTEIEVRASRVGVKVELSSSRTTAPFSFDAPDIEQMDAGARSEFFLRLETEAIEHPCIKEILLFPTPTYLGIDRRFVVNRQAMEGGRPWPTLRSRNRFPASLDDVQSLVRGEMARALTLAADLENGLRRETLLDAFSFTPIDVAMLKQAPEKAELHKVRAKMAEVEEVVGKLGIAEAGEIRKSLTDSFDQILELVNQLENSTALPSHKRGSKVKPHKRSREEMAAIEHIAMRVVFSLPQIDRTMRLARRVETYLSNRRELFAKIDLFTQLLNQFLAQTGKEALVSAENELTVRFVGGGTESLNSLSSGERQVVVMLSHLALGQDDGGRVFMVDEPELSLHLSWQEMFVSAIQTVSPTTQFILATHSPAIVSGPRRILQRSDGSNQCLGGQRTPWRALPPSSGP